MGRKECIEGAQMVAAAHHMTPQETEAYIKKSLASYNRGRKDAEKIDNKEAD